MLFLAGVLSDMFQLFKVWVTGCFLFCVSVTAMAAGGSIRVALDDLPGVDMLPVLVAIERAKEKGLNINVSYMLSEGMAMRTIMNGQADIGMGTPYQKIQTSKAPVRMFYQLNKLRFHPVVNAEKYASWTELDGIDMYSHGAGSGTEAIMNMMAKTHGIAYRKMHYLPGSGVRANAMINGRIEATVVDTERKNKLLAMPDGQFKRLPMPEVNASDEALYANKSFIKSHQTELRILVTELLVVWQSMVENPEFILQQSQKYNLLGGLKESEVNQFFSEMVKEGAFPIDGGLNNAFAADAEFYSFSGTLEGEKDSHKLDDYWDLSVLKGVQLSREPK